MMLEVGKLYSCSEYFLLLYPDKDTAAAVPSAAAAAAVPAAAAGYYADAAAAYWNRKLQNQKPVSYCNPLTPLLVLSVKEKYIEVLAGDKVGWIINGDWLELKEIADDAA
jgi:hypothetical protein